jgi:hypothetical protein
VRLILLAEVEGQTLDDVMDRLYRDHAAFLSRWTDPKRHRRYVCLIQANLTRYRALVSLESKP